MHSIDSQHQWSCTTYWILGCWNLNSVGLKPHSPSLVGLYSHLVDKDIEALCTTLSLCRESYCASVYFCYWAFYFPFINLSTFVPVLRCLNSPGFIISIRFNRVGRTELLPLASFSKNFIILLSLLGLHIPYKFRWSLSIWATNLASTFIYFSINLKIIIEEVGIFKHFLPACKCNIFLHILGVY